MLSFYTLIVAQDSNCDFHQEVVAGQTYQLFSPRYPNNYGPGISCRWIGTKHSKKTKTDSCFVG